MHSILVIEDSLESFVLVRRALGSSARLTWAKSIGEAMQSCESESFDLILLDVILPDGDGFRLCSILQTDERLRKIPVIFLTAKYSVTDKVLGFSVGAEDFITKPFEPLELKARIEARLSRKRRERDDADLIHLGALEIDMAKQQVCSNQTGSTIDIDLTPIEFKLLLKLAKAPNQVFSRDEVLNSVWGQNIFVYSRSVDTHISKLRKKLGECSHYIESVHGMGYRFALDEESMKMRFGRAGENRTDFLPSPAF